MSERGMSVWDSLRQLKYPPEFRLPAPVRRTPGATVEGIRELARLLEPASGGATAACPVDDSGRSLGHLATLVWRVKEKVARLDKAVDRNLALAVDAAWAGLAKAGLEVKVHDGEPVTGGEAFRVLVYEPVDSLDREQVKETVKPSVFYRGARVQDGEVIVGRPSGRSE